MENKVVIIEDEPDICEVISYNLRREGFSVTSVGRGDEGLNVVRKQQPALIILDLMLPGMDGLSVCQQVKADPLTKDTRIIIISAKEEESDVVIGLGLGADDYITKPFGPRELTARVKAVLRRSHVNMDISKRRIVIDELRIDPFRHEVRISGEYVKFTSTEFKLLLQLASQRGQAFTRQQLLDRIVGDGVVIVDRNVDVHIQSVRKKLGVYGKMIQTIRGIGYRFTDESQSIE
ncbi:MAG TPA: DNA-binding response regulator [Gammaproteobacteria bacterium]|nr:DNA-binding response regulator [Gammaproteobacteria bacterium]|tara:strand:- start:900 stop:1601 length:702 start_codon:yes stop_codon:yes gene_type:complete